MIYLPIAPIRGTDGTRLFARLASRLIPINAAPDGVAHSGFIEEQERDMSNTPHTLHEEFPAELDAIHALKAKDAGFAKLLSEYDAVNDKVHRAETRLDAITDEAETALRKHRLALKDAIAKALKTAH